MDFIRSSTISTLCEDHIDREVIDPSVVQVVLLYIWTERLPIGFSRKELPYKSTIFNDLDGPKGE